ncbi:Bug family tripartite tricarboxylate transporter substrate binding protein [Acidovorax sp. SDU_ACID1]|uniref:Bug family tripartite tricarboxylate transporter substrate binding protein n=1 Tax=Acidovorax sp. SDU_ACID1 TaxID=3136632 RepID=UPI003873A742
MKFVRTLLAIAMLATLPAAHAQEDFPNRPVRIIVPWPPGALSDGATRIVAAKLSEEWKQPVVVENKPGANGTIGADLAARAKPDGYTLINTNTDIDSLNQLLYANLPYNAERDFTPVAMMATQAMVLMTHLNYASTTLQQMVEDAKGHPGKLNYASWGRGGVSHMAMELFKHAAGVDITHVPYKGSTPAISDVVSGQVQMMFAGAASGMSLYQGQKVRVLGVASAQRLRQLPGIPTIAEQGYPGFEVETWNGISAPAGTPAAVVRKISAAVQRALSDPAIAQRLETQGATVVTGSPEHYRDFIRARAGKWQASVDMLGIKPE